MPLNILLADDSVPAQNMGKKILVDAGYDVLTVSNGLEALRRIAEATPDIAILDIFMPGYTGLEICERLRSNASTASLPVILTVGKLEPYRPADGENVRSNAVIVKPFVAAELISAVRSLIGAPPLAPAQPEPAGEIPPVNPGADPLRENYVSAEVLERPTPSTAVPPMPPEQVAEGLRGEAQDEPLFSNGELPAPGNAAPLTPPERSVYAAEPLLDGGELGGPESLVFNPDAERTPFSASAVDLLSPASEFPAEEDESPFSEFDLEVDASSYVAGQGSEFSVVEEPMLPVSAAAELPAIAPEPAVTTEEVVSGAVAPLELELPAMETPVTDPLLEVQEAAVPSSVATTSEDAGQALKEILVEVAPADEEVAATASAVQFAQDEEARRLAFEELFNSTEAIPLEEDSAAGAEPLMEALPSIANTSREQIDDIAQDSELETPSDDNQSAFIVSEPDPYLLEEEPTLHAFEKIPNRDPLLLEDESASSWPMEQVLEPREASTSARGKIDLPQPEEGSDLTAEAPVEARPLAAESHPETLEIFETAPAAERAQRVPEAELEPARTAVEAAPEPVHVDEPRPEPEPVLVAPVLAPVEPAHCEVATHVEAASSSPEVSSRPSEVERIHQAVERVFDRFKPVLIAAIVRELARHD